MTRMITVSEDEWDKLEAVYEAADWLIKVHGTPERNMELTKAAWTNVREAIESVQSQACPECGSDRVATTTGMPPNRADCQACDWTGQELADGTLQENEL